jgi:hypothetical protein
LKRAHDIAGDPDDAILLAKQVERLEDLFGEVDYSTWWKHALLQPGLPGYFLSQAFERYPLMKSA